MFRWLLNRLTGGTVGSILDGMKVTDLTPVYLEHFLDHGDSRGYFSSRPGLFAHYQNYWGRPDSQPVRLEPTDLGAQRSNVLDCLTDIEERFIFFGLDLSDMELILMVGQNTSNGHAFVDDDRAVAWLAIETYTTPSLARVFVTHELVHALHYHQNVPFRFATKEQMLDPMRQLLTEGIATYLTQVILKVDSATALWADYLAPEQAEEWMIICRKERSAIVKQFQTARQDGSRTELFLANDPNDVLKFRSGYYLGLWVIERIVSKENLSPLQLLRYPRVELEAAALKLLKE